MTQHCLSHVLALKISYIYGTRERETDIDVLVLKDIYIRVVRRVGFRSLFFEVARMGASQRQLPLMTSAVN